VVSWLGDAGKILDYGVRFTKPVAVPANGQAVIMVVAKVAELDLEEKKQESICKLALRATTFWAKRKFGFSFE